MTIRFACSCGQQLTAPDEYTGQRVCCPSCGAFQGVPYPPPADAALISFDCVCGQRCQARPEYAGRSTRCPRCNLSIPIPTTSETNGIRAGSPPSSSTLRLPDCELAQQGVSPALMLDRRRKTRWQIGLALLGVVLILGAAAAWHFLWRPTSVSSDFDLVPRDAQAVFTIRPSQLLQTRVGLEILGGLGEQRDVIAQAEEEFGIGPNDVERMTAVVADASKQLVWVILQTDKPVDQNRIIGARGGSMEATHQGLQYYSRGPQEAFAFFTDRLLVFGPEAGVKRCLTLPRRPGTGPLDPVLQLASDPQYQLVGGVNITEELLREARRGTAVPEGAVQKLLDLRRATISLRLNGNVDLAFRATFQAEDKAREALDSLQQTLVLLRLFVAKGALKDLPNPTQDGNEIRLDWQLSPTQVTLLVTQIRAQFGLVPRP